MADSGVMRSVLLVVALLLGATGCSGSSDASDPTAGESARPSPSQDPSGSSDPFEPPAVPAEDPPPCEKVRAGIDAFNEGAPELTVRFFAQALPQAEQYVEDEPGRTADLLLAAVRYYAELPADEYADAITGSAAFQRHQVVTLSVCRYGEDSGEPGRVPTDDAVPA